MTLSSLPSGRILYNRFLPERCETNVIHSAPGSPATLTVAVRTASVNHKERMILFAEIAWDADR